LWKAPAREDQAERERLAWALGSGLRYLSAAPNLPPVLLRVLAFCMSTIGIIALLPVIARDQLGLGPRAYGILYGGYGLGAILGGLILADLRHRMPSEWIVRAVALVNAAAVALLAVGGNFWVALISTVMSGACWLMTHSLLNSGLQLATPRWMVGRVIAMYMTAAYLGLSVGSWLWGALAERVGTREALALSAAGLVGTFLLGYWLPSPREAPKPSDLDPSAEPWIPPDFEGHAGPIQVLIDYRIDQGDLPEFLRLMDERRRQIMRLGARRWTLSRDFKDPAVWTESFRTSDNGVYRRMMRRRSIENLGLRRRLWELHRDAGRPEVRLLLEEARNHKVPEPLLRT
jgi:hypothetical protein